MSTPYAIGKLADSNAVKLNPLDASDFHGMVGGHRSKNLMPMSGGFQKALAGTAGKASPLSSRDHVLNSSTAILGPHEKLVHETQRWVAQTFYGTMLKQMHDSPFKASWVDGGRGGQAFQPLLDQHMIDHIAKSSSKKLVNSIVRRIEGKRGYAQQKAGGLNNATMPSAQPNLPPHGTQTLPPNMESYVSPNIRA
jgi:Rod binding domain-containing protein